jgi:tetratricopeptide (TPR) repeat protein
LGRVKSETLRVKPHFIANVNYNIGTALEQQGKLSEAIDHFSAALRIEPNFVGAHNNLGIALSRQGKLDEAISYFSEALRIKPDDAAARRNLKRALRLAGKEGSHQQVEAYEEPGKEE